MDRFHIYTNVQMMNQTNCLNDALHRLDRLGEKIIAQINVINDTKKRVIKLIEEYNSTIVFKKKIISNLFYKL